MYTRVRVGDAQAPKGQKSMIFQEKNNFFIRWQLQKKNFLRKVLDGIRKTSRIIDAAKNGVRPEDDDKSLDERLPRTCKKVIKSC
jgi:DNA-binding transcriptional regulator GbsR (MarR family)